MIMPRRTTPGLALGGVAAIALAGCGGQARHGAHPEASARTTATSSVASTATVASGGGSRGKDAAGDRRRTRAADRQAIAVAPGRSKAARHLRQEEPPTGEDPPVGRAPTTQPTWSYQAHLPAQTTTHQRLSHTLTVTINLHGNRVCWKFGTTPTVYVSTSAFGRVRAALKPTSASIDADAHGHSGAVLIPLGVRYSSRGCAGVAPSLVNTVAAAPKLYYLQVSASRFPAITVRGQLSSLTGRRD
jgi:hypothetical protein